MRRVLDAGAVLLGPDLAVEIGGHVLELADHVPEIGNLARLLVGLEPLEPQCRFRVRSSFDTPDELELCGGSTSQVCVPRTARGDRAT